MSTWEIIKCLIAFVIGGFLLLIGFVFTVSINDLGAVVGGLFLTLLGDFCLAYIPASIAFFKGHSYGKWFLYAFFFLPISFVHSIMLTDGSKEYKECPFCSERIKRKAKVCRYCGRDLTVNNLAPSR